MRAGYTKGLPVKVDTAVINTSPDGVSFQCHTYTHEMLRLVEQPAKPLVSLFEKFCEPPLFFSLLPMPGDDIVRYPDVAVHDEACLASAWKIGLEGNNHSLL